MTNFRFQGTRAFLTYPQASCTKRQLFEFLIELGNCPNSIPITKVLVAQESHENGGTHFHCYVEFQRKPNIRQANYFDFQGNHPNIQTVRSKNDVIRYCTKEDIDPLVWPEDWHYQEASKSTLDILRRGIAEGKSPNDILDDALTANPNSIRYYSQQTAYVLARTHASKVCMPKYELDGFALSGSDMDRMQRFASTVATMRRGERTDVLSMWFTGPSRYGKTSLARSIGRHWYMQSTWHLDKYCDDQGVYGVLDDLPWESLKHNYKSLLGCQEDVSWTDKYRAKKHFQFGYPVIVCTNHLPDFSEEEKSWLRSNVVFFQFNSSVVPAEDDRPVESLQMLRI